MTPDRDVEKSYSVPEFVGKLRRLADALEAGEAFTIQVDGERIVVPKSATISVEHEREDGEEELEFQLKWASADAGPEDEEDEEEEEDEEDQEQGAKVS